PAVIGLAALMPFLDRLLDIRALEATLTAPGLGVLGPNKSLDLHEPAWVRSDEVHAAAGLFGLAAGDFGDRRLAEDFAQGGDALGPDAAGLVGLVADFAVERLDDVEDGDLLGRPRQGVAAAHAAVAGQQAVAAQ